MEIEERMPPRRREMRPRFCQSQMWNNTVFTVSYWFFEMVCFTAVLSMSIGLSALAALGNEYFLEQKMSIFVQTYITLFVLYNFGNFQARHQIVYIFPLRARFGNQLSYCFACNYPCSTSFFILVVAYLNLVYQFSKLFCHPSWELPTDSRKGHTLAKLVEEDGTARKVHDIEGEDGNGWREMGFGVGIPQVGMATMTALFLLGLSAIEYLTCRKLRWDYYLETARIPHPPVFPSCGSFLYALFILLFIQLVLTVLYSVPILLWILLAKLCSWHFSTTLLTTALWSVIIGYIGAFVERQEPFPTINHSRMYQIINLKLRSYLMCLLYIPGLGYWFFTIEGTPCLTVATGQGQRSTHYYSNLFNYFLLTVSICIMNTTKYVRLSSIDRHRDQLRPLHPLPHINVLGGGGHIYPEGQGQGQGQGLGQGQGPDNGNEQGQPQGQQPSTLRDDAQKQGFSNAFEELLANNNNSNDRNNDASQTEVKLAVEGNLNSDSMKNSKINPTNQPDFIVSGNKSTTTLAPASSDDKKEPGIDDDSIEINPVRNPSTAAETKALKMEAESDGNEDGKLKTAEQKYLVDIKILSKNDDFLI